VALAITGFAGPGGEKDEEGRVHFAAGHANGMPSRLKCGRLRLPRGATFTVAPHLQIINYPGCFSRFAGI
jgi:hypothetical protein